MLLKLKAINHSIQNKKHSYSVFRLLVFKCSRRLQKQPEFLPVSCPILTLDAAMTSKDKVLRKETASGPTLHKQREEGNLS